MAKTSLKVAAAQIACRPGDLRANLDAHLAMIERAEIADVELLVFPELSLTDYLADPDCDALGMARDDPMLSLLAQSACGMAVSVGFIERGSDGLFYNAQALLTAGKVLAVHRKLNLPGYGLLREDHVYARGNALETAALPCGWRVDTLICADAWNPALPWLAALSGIDLLLVPAASALGAVGDGFDNPRGWEINLAHSAMTYGVPVVFANHCGERGGVEFWGGSRILDAFGRELVRAGATPGLVAADLSFADGEAARRRLPTMRDSDPELIGRLLAERLDGGRGMFPGRSASVPDTLPV